MKTVTMHWLYRGRIAEAGDETDHGGRLSVDLSPWKNIIGKQTSDSTFRVGSR